MSRYNHHVLEKKWLNKLVKYPPSKSEFQVCTVFLPKEGLALDLENLRLLMLADFFSYCPNDNQGQILWLGAEGLGDKVAQDYGFNFSNGGEQNKACDLLLVPRDFAHLTSHISCGEKLLCGRFLDKTPLGELHGDFGLDALRLFFLSQGPPDRDYGLNWHNLAASFRFVEKIWGLGQVLKEGFTYTQREDPQVLELCVSDRWKQKKPHTALAAIMGFLKDKDQLTPYEVYQVIRLLRPYMPILAEELLTSVAPI